VSASRDVPPWLKQALNSTQYATDALRRLAEVQVPPDAFANAARALDHYQAVQPSLLRTIQGIEASRRVAEGIEQLWRQNTPENWHELDDSGELDVVDLVEQSGIPVMWAPRAAIIEELIAAENSERYEVLVRSSGDVLDDLAAVLERARGADVEGHAEACDFADEAIAAARDGHWSAAQAVTASGLGQVLHGMLGYPVFRGLGGAYRKFSQRDVEETAMMVLKAALLEVCTARALTDIHKAQLAGFNRHGTQHGDRRFFSQANALCALLLLLGWIREFTWLDERGLLTEREDTGEEAN
jgi:hypothetical protein